MQTEVKDNLAVSHLNPNMTMKTINLWIPGMMIAAEESAMRSGRMESSKIKWPPFQIDTWHNTSKFDFSSWQNLLPRNCPHWWITSSVTLFSTDDRRNPANNSNYSYASAFGKKWNSNWETTPTSQTFFNCGFLILEFSLKQKEIKEKNKMGPKNYFWRR